jgi:peptidylamidoglycolate lyase
MNVFKERSLGAIKDNTVITFERETGKVLKEWGSNLFYMPHGLHIRGKYYYITDVGEWSKKCSRNVFGSLYSFFSGLHQVFRFNVDSSTTEPELVIGEAFKPGNSAKLFCKPTSVASLENGDFFVADGYCNGRVIKYNSNGERILEVRVHIEIA